jgi:Fe-Mn family superoxide dismutase
MKHQTKNFDHLLGKLEGISEPQLKAHFGLYQGYVNKLNEIETALGTSDPTGGNYSYNAYSELKRREAVAFNGAYLHELYFDNLAAPGQSADEAFKAAAQKSFGSFDNWVAHTKGAAASTPGWVLTTYSRVDQALHNYVLFEHHVGLPVHQDVILALDCWEHAYMVDYSTQKAKYLEAFLKNVNWKVVGERLKRAVKG